MYERKKNRKNKIYRIGIDARFFGLENKGLGRYTNELVEWLDKLIEDSIKTEFCGPALRFEYYIFLREDNFDNYQPQAKNIHKVKDDYYWYSWQEQLLFPFILKKYNLDLIHFTHFNVPVLYRLLGLFSGKNKFIVTIHDLILFHYPTIKNTTLNKIFYFFKLGVYHIIIRIVARQAELIIAISEFTKKDIIESLGISGAKIKVIYEGAEFSDQNDPEERSKEQIFANKLGVVGSKSSAEPQDTIFEKYDILNRYLLYVGNAYPHKNLERLVLAFDKLDVDNKDSLQLVLVGKRDYFYEKLEEFINERGVKNVIITDYVSDQELGQLYRGTELFVFPSLYEGFGLPPLEALVKGLLVVSSAKSSLLEILGNNVKYFDPESVESMKEGIEDVLLNGGVTLTNEEIREIKNKYSWEKMTKKTMEIYKSLFKVLS